VRRRASYTAGRETKVTRLTRELNESLEQQMATAEVLRIVASSPTDVQPMFDMIARIVAHFVTCHSVAQYGFGTRLCKNSK
jgi:two-component system, NtrC family, sensor kinase